MSLNPLVANPETYKLGKARARLNPLTGDWLVDGQEDSLPYVCDTWLQASRMLQTVDHFNRTGEVKAFLSKPKKWFKD